ncbi:TetR/AcrR family transcriptional regulator [Exilibacterium tricleocarpae]|uniref:TetR/AcrR family transcriptional regulator n=2 Tax=Exilibacterium tricleocarpae TaxID=2591008 RepID=A0A545TZT5_9GAMM|nr:TetR/AcrR family transcriptional regulator [Exilibacterium tricleocarpae]
MGVAWTIVRKEGAEALTLGHLAEQSGVTKPVVYDHFGTRSGLLVALYREFDVRQTALIEQAIKENCGTLESCAKAIADGYVDCVMAQAKEIPGVAAALGTLPELEKVKRTCKTAFLKKCQAALAPFSPSGAVHFAGLQSMLGAAEALSYAAAAKDITEQQAKQELRATITDMVARQVG